MSYNIALREASDRASSQARPRPPKVPKVPFRFLDLPPDAIKLKPLSKALPLSLRRANPVWNYGTRRFLGLTRVCKEIRKEFLPLHLADHTVQLDGLDLERYLALVLTRMDGPLSHAVGNFVVQPFDDEEYYCDFKPELSFGLLTLVELCTIAPRFNANILSSDDETKHLQIVPLTWTPTWQKWADIRLVDLIYWDWTSDEFRAAVEVEVKLAHRVQWEMVDYDEERLICDLEQDMERWMEKVGWGHSKSTVEVEVIFAVC